MTDLVVVSLEPWDEVWRRNQYLVAGLLEADPELRVLFVEPPRDPLHDVRRGGRPQLGDGLRVIAHPEAGPGVAAGAPARLWAFQPTKLLPRRVDPWGDSRMARSVERAAERLGMTDPVLWVNDPAGATLLRRTGWAALYDITDDWLAAHRTPREHARLVADEDLLLRECAEVVVCSESLVATKGRTRPVTLVPNAVDVDLYRRPVPRPADLPTGPTALYVGTVHPDRIDVDLCVRTGRRLADLGGHLVLVGPLLVGGAERDALEEVGVALLGPRPWSAVPAYLQHADVLVVPHVVDPFTDSLDPIKLYEYLAVGRPVVSTPVAGFREVVSPLVHVADEASFVEGVTAAVLARADGDVPAPSAAADVPTWRQRVSQVQEVLARVRRPAPTPR